MYLRDLPAQLLSQANIGFDLRDHRQQCFGLCARELGQEGRQSGRHDGQCQHLKGGLHSTEQKTKHETRPRLVHGEERNKRK